MIQIRATASNTASRARSITFALGLLLALMLAFTLEAGIANAATFNVINTSDSGPGSLRQAIIRANANSNPTVVDSINFNIPAASDPGCEAGSGVCTISPERALPEITQSVSINGYSQSGASPNTLATGNNAQLKIELSGAGAGSTDEAITITGPNSVVRGLIVNRWQGDGIFIVEPEAIGNKIQGNFVGTDPAGTQALANGDDGVQITNAAVDNVVGGTSPAARNVISGNIDDGISIFLDANGNRIEGNYLGTDATGTEALGNEDDGVQLSLSSNNTVGGLSTGAANVILFNGENGVQLIDNDPTGNSILRNSIFSNGELGIDLGDDGVTPNDPQDPDPGPNLLQNFPVITSATTPNGQSTSIQGTLNSTPNDSFTIQLFSSPTADPSGYGEGKTYLGQTNVTTNASGNTTFSLTSNTPVLAGEVVTATATNSVTRDTSEFSEAVEVEDTTRPTVVSSKPPDGATGVLPATNVSVIFSEQMRASTINTNTFQLFERVGSTQVPVEGEVSYNATFKRGVFDSEENLTRGLRYVAKVTVGARDLAGNRLEQTETIVFVVEE